MKTIFCTYCAGQMEVGEKAMSVFCTHCRKRLILENYKVKTYKAVREFFTCGDIVVEKKGAVAARVFASNLTVKGKVSGEVRARSKVEISKTGNIHGDISAPRLVVHAGAVIEGFCRIGPEGAPADSN
ncbi:MAG: polymer-forming cytoskeletal protein [Phycisphaerae bacterium]